MTRFPWETGSAHRGHDDDGGESLHTDVMRFMAIIALCLVAIFALVRSLPLNVEMAPPSRDPSPAAAESLPVERAAASPAEEMIRSRAEPILRPRPPRERHDEAVSETRPQAVSRRELEAGPGPAPRPKPAQSPGPAPNVSPDAPPREGFSLRFASDQALQAMIADGRVQVYARTSDGRWWRSERSRAALFRPGAAPAHLHDMSTDTVPAAMLAALRRDAGPSIEARRARWGVSLPPDVEARIGSLVEGSRAGLLVIAPSGRVTLHPFGEDGGDG